MTASLISDALDGIDSRFVEEALDEPAARRLPFRTVLVRCAAAAACVLLAVGMLRWLSPAQTPSVSDTAATVTHLPMESHPLYPFDTIYPADDLAFSQSDSYESIDSMISYLLEHSESDMFTGTITQIDTLDLESDGAHHYVLLAYIQLDTVYRGDFQSGDEVRVLLADTLYEENSHLSRILCSFEVGNDVLLAAVRTDTSQTLLENGITLNLPAIADYIHRKVDLTIVL